MLEVLLYPHPPTDSGVWLDPPPRPGTVVVAPLDVTGETQAVEGVLRVDLYVVRGTTLTPVASYAPALPLGTIPFDLRWHPAGTAPGRVTLRVVATTLARGFSADVTGLVVPRPAPAAHVAREVRPPQAAPARAAVARPAPVAAPAGLDDSGAAFGGVAPVLPYVRPVPPSPAPAALSPLAAPAPVRERRGAVSFAAGLLALLGSAHVHRALRPRSPR